MTVIATDMTQAEWEVMRVIWTLGELGSNDIIKAVQEKREWTESTIKTLLRRLVKRGALSTSTVGRKFIYHPEIAERVAMEATSTALFDHLCAMKKGGVLANLVKETELSQADIRQLQALLTTKAKNAPEQVACDCLGPNREQDCTCSQEASYND
ncbi:CopY/TcrY family copper transport repressor [uncultured Secundilactobacillus sp.]|uniref:CopY/TcrY family copper transport repressor n=1 Tax=uncultured Secundilactobacillus sp. TaxID=2813935 RepID=UPI002586ECB5|nr:CopY/TcrY family copper transport repressor [uncultured Secundilactobacillus sp.]